MKAKPFICRYCKNPVREDSPSYYNCGCRTKPSPTYMSVSVILANDEYEKAIKHIHHLTVHAKSMSADELSCKLKEIEDYTKEVASNVASIKENY